MAANLSNPIMHRLVAHKAYLQTVDFGEDLIAPNTNGAENLLLGRSEELAEKINFHIFDSTSCFQNGIASAYPFHSDYVGRSLVALVPDSQGSDRGELYGIYKIKGMQDIVDRCREKRVIATFMEMEFSEKLNLELSRRLNKSIKNNVYYLPTENYDLLKKEEKNVTQYNRVTIVKVPVPSPSRCSVS